MQASQNICFVISPIGKQNSDIRNRADDVLSELIRPAVQSYGFTPIRGEEYVGSPVLTTVIQALLTASLAIADLTNYNPNVLYEVAIRHFTRKPLILIRDKYHDADDSVPFNIYTERVFEFNSASEDGYKECRENIKERIRELLDSGLYEPQETPIYNAINSLHNKSDPELQDQLNSMMLNFEVGLSAHSEYIKMTDLIEAGLLHVYPNRNQALAGFKDALSSEGREIFVIGSSLKGLIQENEEEEEIAKEIRGILKDRIAKKVRMRFLLTHPAVADLRADQETNVEYTDIGKEIIKSLEILENWGVPAENVGLYKGAPTIFAIRTSSQMLLNPYAYTSVAYNSPCFIFDNTGDRQTQYLYRLYDESHFGAWKSAIRVRDYEFMRPNLRSKLETYRKNVVHVLTEAQ